MNGGIYPSEWDSIVGMVQKRSASQKHHQEMEEKKSEGLKFDYEWILLKS